MYIEIMEFNKRAREKCSMGLNHIYLKCRDKVKQEIEVIGEWDQLQRLNKNMIITTPSQSYNYMKVKRRRRGTSYRKKRK